jgi:hypothetical protein
MPWVLVLLKVVVDIWERNGRWVGEGGLWNLCCEFVKELAEKGECRSDGVLLVGDDHGYNMSVSYPCMVLRREKG